MNLLFFLPLLVIITVPVYAEQVIFSDGNEYEFGNILSEYTMSKNSQMLKTQGYTTTGELFFLRVSPTFEKVMLLDNYGNWQKAELREKTVESVESTNSEVIEDGTELHYLLDQYERVYSKDNYKFFVKTFDKSIYAGSDFENFQGKVSGATISALITDPDGVVQADFEGYVENGIFEGSVLVPENLWSKGWYTVDIVIEYEDDFYHDQLTFYVYGVVAPDGGSVPIP